MYKYVLILLLLIVSFSLFGQSADQRGVQQETVTFLETTKVNDFLQILESFSLKYESKKIMNLSTNNEPIGVPIHNLTWRKALELIALKNGLVIEDGAGVIYVKNAEKQLSVEQAMQLPKSSDEINTKQVRISAIAFNCDRAFLKSLGIDWSTLLNGKVSANVGFATSASVPTPTLSISGSRTTPFNGGTIEVKALLAAIESNQVGTIIARPTVVVSSGKSGFLQVGQDVSIKSVDDAGNTIDKFFQVGVIMDVAPTVIKADSSDAEVIHLVTSIERSSATPGEISTVNNKNKATTNLILYDGEETVIAGLYDTDEMKIWSGIPFLKDLPWWVFGIRYMTGFFKIDKKERELVIIIKANIIDSALVRQQKQNQ